MQIGVSSARMLPLLWRMFVQNLEKIVGVPPLGQNFELAMKFFLWEIFEILFSHFVWVHVCFRVIPHLTWFRRKKPWDKNIYDVAEVSPHSAVFLWDFDPLDINANRGFFSQNDPLVMEDVCANFGKNRGGTPIGPKF